MGPYHSCIKWVRKNFWGLRRKILWPTEHFGLRSYQSHVNKFVKFVPFTTICYIFASCFVVVTCLVLHIQCLRAWIDENNRNVIIRSRVFFLLLLQKDKCRYSTMTNIYAHKDEWIKRKELKGSQTWKKCTDVKVNIFMNEWLD